jgi:hypothetical protein
MIRLILLIIGLTSPLLFIWGAAWILEAYLPNNWIEQWYGAPLVATSILILICLGAVCIKCGEILFGD